VIRTRKIILYILDNVKRDLKSLLAIII